MASFSRAATCLLFVMVFLVSLYQANGAASIRKGPCPEGKLENDQWEEDGCRKCTCLKDSVSCASCPSFYLDSNKPYCYTVPGPGAYPKCCLRRPVCYGDPEYDGRRLKNP